MRLSLQWLQDDYQLNFDAKALADRLTMAGLEVDAIELAAPEFTKVVVGEVIDLQSHPNADKLRIAMVNVGEVSPLQIVCGAANVAKGIRVPTALIGAHLPGDLKIKKSKLRGVESSGMLCSAVELGLSESSDGLLLLADDAPIGRCVRDYLQLNDHILEIDLTPNRADAFSIRGLAREIGVLFGQQPTFVEELEQPTVGNSPIKVMVDAVKACPIYHVRVIDRIDMSATTPIWMAERLRRAGIRPHDPVVDVTNYVMLALGTPMHAFDFDKVDGDLVVRFATNQEKLTLLNGNHVTLGNDTLIIADQQKPLAIAGVMGGAHSACNRQTKRIILESAWFDPVCIAGKARHFGLSSDAAQRFERGVDTALQIQAMEMATRFITEICGGHAYTIASVVVEAQLPKREEITLIKTDCSRLIGRDYDDEIIEKTLKQLGCQIKENEQGWQVKPPSWRFDMEIAEDLVEEVARIEGYDNIDPVLPTLVYRPNLEKDKLSRYWSDQLIALGFQEAITYSFVSREAHQIFFSKQQAITLSNPISAQLSQMRLSLLPGLVNCVMYNRHRQQLDLRLFEMGKVFLPNDKQAKNCCQQTRMAGVMTGLAQPEQWASSTHKIDFYHIKGVVEILLNGVGGVDYRETIQPYLHPGQAADIYINDIFVGVVGALHPKVQQSLGIKGNPIWVFEFIEEYIKTTHKPSFKDISKYPTVRRDLALVVEQSVKAIDIENVITTNIGSFLEDFFWFDVYKGDSLADDKKSLAVAILLKGDNKTLQDEEVDCIIARLVERLKETFGAELR